jgi:tetratricopeptide (TPR) repeat protein
LKQGHEERARAELDTGIAERPDDWKGHYSFACLEARAGDKEAALRHLARAAELDPDEVAKLAARDEDFAALREDDRFLAIAGQADSAGSGS